MRYAVHCVNRETGAASWEPVQAESMERARDDLADRGWIVGEVRAVQERGAYHGAIPIMSALLLAAAGIAGLIAFMGESVSSRATGALLMGRSFDATEYLRAVAQASERTNGLMFFLIACMFAVMAIQSWHLAVTMRAVRS